VSGRRHIALSASLADRDLARLYERHFQELFSRDPEEGARVHWVDLTDDPAAAQQRMDMVRTAAGLVVVSSFVVSRKVPSNEAQLDMGIALGAGVPVFLTEGYPPTNDLPSPFANADRLRALGVLSVPDGAHTTQLSERAAYIAGHAQAYPAYASTLGGNP
jgi:hypothetical protein